MEGGTRRQRTRVVGNAGGMLCSTLLGVGLPVRVLHLLRGWCWAADGPEVVVLGPGDCSSHTRQGAGCTTLHRRVGRVRYLCTFSTSGYGPCSEQQRMPRSQLAANGCESEVEGTGLWVERRPSSSSAKRYACLRYW